MDLTKDDDVDTFNELLKSLIESDYQIESVITNAGVARGD